MLSPPAERFFSLLLNVWAAAKTTLGRILPNRSHNGGFICFRALGAGGPAGLPQAQPPTGPTDPDRRHPAHSALVRVHHNPHWPWADGITTFFPSAPPEFVIS